MAVRRKFNGKYYSYRGSDRFRGNLRHEASKLRKQGYLTRIIKTGKGKDILYTLYVHKK